MSAGQQPPCVTGPPSRSGYCTTPILYWTKDKIRPNLARIVDPPRRIKTNRPLTQRTTLSILIAAACLTAFGLTPAQTARAQGTVATLPLQRYGLGSLECAAYSPDGKHVATGGGIGVVLWDANTGDQVRILSAPGHYVLSVAFSPDGTKILTGSWYPDCTAKLWDAETGAAIQTFGGHTKWVESVAFSPDGRKVLTGGGDGLTLLWDSEHRKASAARWRFYR